jgi:hypothetical protein
VLNFSLQSSGDMETLDEGGSSSASSASRTDSKKD